MLGIFLSGFNYSIEYVKSKDNIADYSSRFPVESSEGWVENDSYINFLSTSNSKSINTGLVSRETLSDKLLSVVKNSLSTGTLSNLNGEEFKYFKNNADEFSLENDLVMRGYKLVIPTSLRKQILEELHKSHIGVVKTKSLARSYVWWPGLDRDIENFAKECKFCLEQSPLPTSAKLIPWDPPEYCWSRIHVDFAGPKYGWYYLIIVDAFSKWIEIFHTKSITSNG